VVKSSQRFNQRNRGGVGVVGSVMLGRATVISTVHVITG
jgi:hypothetical protein